jgi:MFS family permease
MKYKNTAFSWSQPSSYYRYIIVSIAFIVMVIAWGVNYSFGVFFTPLLDEFGWTRAMTSGAFSLAMFSEGFGGIFMGRICDRFGPRLVVSVCGILLGIGYILMSQVSTIWHLYLFYGVVIGIGLSGTYVPVISAISKLFNRRRGLMTGIVSSGMGVGTFFVTPFATWLILVKGWRFSYMTIGLATMIIIIVSARFLQISNGKNSVATEPHKTRQSGSDNSIINTNTALKTVSLWLICFVFVCWGTVVFAILVHIAPYAIEAGFSKIEAANILIIFGGSVFFIKIITGIITDRLGSKPVFALGIGMLTIVLVMLITIHELWVLYLFAVVHAFCYGSGSVTIPNIVTEMFGLNYHGMLTGIVNFSACIGCAIGPLAAGWLFDITGNYYASFMSATLLGVITLIMVLFIKSKNKTAV